MLRFTSAGAVQAPTTLQVRVARTFSDRVIAGAPSPTRSMSRDEVLQAIHAYTEASRGPRTRPCTQLVLSGVPADLVDELPQVLEQARTWGMERVTVHAGPALLEALTHPAFAAQVDAVAVTVRCGEDARAVASLQGLFRTAVVLLDDAALGSLGATVQALADAAPERVVFTWPLPPSAPPPPADRVAQVLQTVVTPLDQVGVVWGIKGLPACRLGPLADRLWRSGNRWYVDAEHQGADALLFFPDVLRFAKGDICRFCALDGSCDGAPEPWVRAGLAGRMEPVPTE